MCQIHLEGLVVPDPWILYTSPFTCERDAIPARVRAIAEDTRMLGEIEMLGLETIA